MVGCEATIGVAFGVLCDFDLMITLRQLKPACKQASIPLRTGRREMRQSLLQSPAHRTPCALRSC